MRKIILFCAMALFMVALGGAAWAIPYSATETYLGGAHDRMSVEIGHNGSRNFGFDFTGSNTGTAGLTGDASGFVPGMSISSALLSFSVSSNDFLPERIRLVSGNGDGGRVMFDRTMFLGGFISRNECTFTIDLLSLGMGNFLRDGVFSLGILAPGCWNDFTLENISMTIRGDTGTAPVPEPATLLLLSGGIAGIFGAKRFKRSAV